MKVRCTDNSSGLDCRGDSAVEPSYVDRLWQSELQGGLCRARDFAPAILHRLGLDAAAPGKATRYSLMLRLRRRFAVAAIVAVSVTAGVLLRLESYEPAPAATARSVAERSPQYLVDRVFTTVDRFAYFVNVADANVASAEWFDAVPTSLEEILPRLTQYLIIDTLDPTGPSAEAVPVEPRTDDQDAQAEHASLS